MEENDQVEQAQAGNTGASTQMNQVSVETIHIPNQELEVSGISDTDSRMSFLQNEINAITSNFTVKLEKIASQASVQDENQRIIFEQQKEISVLLRGMISHNSNQGLVISTPETSTTKEGQLSSPESHANHLLSSEEASDSARADGTGS